MVAAGRAPLPLTPMPNLILIDDSPDDREWIEGMARGAGGFAVASFASSAEGVAHFREHGADCILLDRRLDGEDGLAVLSRLKMETIFCPVIMLTGDEDVDLPVAAVRSGAARYLPKARLDAATLSGALTNAIAEGAAQRKRAGLGPRARRITLIDDNPDDRLHLRDMMARADPDLEIDDFATGRAAIDHLKARGADCVLLDYRLEAEDGLAVLATIRAVRPDLPVVMLTGQGSEEIAATAIRMGAADYRIKDRETGATLSAAIENAISRAALEARVAEQEAERRRFLNIVVHDLRAPLRRVDQLGAMAEAEVRASARDAPAKLLDALRSAARSADGLIEALHAYALLDQDVPMGPASLTEAAEAARDNLAVQIRERGATVEIGDLPAVRGNPSQLLQLMQNLIQNGLKYNESPQPVVAIEGRIAGEGAERSAIVTVRDNGLGIPEDHLQSIFDPLKRLWSQDQYAGDGLGLAICRKVVERHGGAIWCESTPGEGSVFHIRFPSVA